ncbi:MAG: YtxH domain-containing protein [Acidobacteriota bacterium]
MNEPACDRNHHGFTLGLLAGTVVGAGIALWLTPRASSELRRRVKRSMQELGDRTADGYRQASGRVHDAIDDLAANGQEARDGLADAVARGAHEVGRFANAAKSGHRG